jgi:hypothetical protein
MVESIKNVGSVEPLDDVENGCRIVNIIDRPQLTPLTPFIDLLK